MSEATDFLYPFIEADERDSDALLIDLDAIGARQGAGQCRAPTSDARPVGCGHREGRHGDA